MEVACPECGASLRLNPNLAGTTVSCPQCAARVAVPDAVPDKLSLEPDEPAPQRAPRRTRRAPERPAPTARPPGQRYTLWMLGVQAVLVLLGLSCLFGAFFRTSWNPPAWSYFQENALILMGVGVAFLTGGWAAQRLPVLTALAVAVCVLLVCSWNYVWRGEVDASRVIALALSMLALWFALQHRRASSPAQ